MAVLINFKICDNSKECGGVNVCPTGALFWNEEKDTISIDNSKCISCGLCEKECPISAIAVAKNQEEYNKYQKEIDDDKRTTKDLFVDRYGAVAISEFFKIDLNEIDKKTQKNCITLIELYNPDLAECLLKSIPIKELTQFLSKDTLYYKAECKNIVDKYVVNTLPALLFFKDGKQIGKVEGYYSEDEKDELIEKIQKIIK